MSYNEPPEWQGRQPRSREGWPTTYRGAPRRHRAPHDIGEEQVAIVRTETGEFRPARGSYPADALTDPRGDREMLLPAERAPHWPTEMVLRKDDDPVFRMYVWLGVAVRILGVVALAATIWVLGMVIADNGVPLWVPGR